MTGTVAGMSRADYLRHRDRMIAYGRWQPYVPAAPAREHVRALSAQGVGWKQVADLAGVSRSAVGRLLHGTGDRPPTRLIRPETEKAILAVRVSLDVITGQTVIDPAGTRRRLQALTAQGWSMPQLAARLGKPHKANTFGDILRCDIRVRASTARTVRALYDELCGRVPRCPPEATRWERSAAAKTRNRAAREGWAPPGAWDDEPGPHCIDDPAATPAPGWDGEPGRPPAAAALIRQARERKGLSQRGLALVVGVTRQAVSYWEAGKRSPEPESWQQLELALGPLGVVRDRSAGAGDEGQQREGEAA